MASTVVEALEARAAADQEVPSQNSPVLPAAAKAACGPSSATWLILRLWREVPAASPVSCCHCCPSQRSSRPSSPTAKARLASHAATARSCGHWAAPDLTSAQLAPSHCQIAWWLPTAHARSACTAATLCNVTLSSAAGGAVLLAAPAWGTTIEEVEATCEGAVTWYLAMTEPRVLSVDRWSMVPLSPTSQAASASGTKVTALSAASVSEVSSCCQRW
jgi:hypothetical protein